MVAMTALTSFTDGVIVRQAELNNLASNIDALCQMTTGKPASLGHSSKPMALVRINANQDIPGNTDTLINWNAADYDTDNLWVPSVPNHFTVNTAGKYVIRTGVIWNANANGGRITKIFVNGTANPNAVATTDISASNVFETSYTTESPAVPLAYGATVYVNTWQNGVNPLTLSSAYGGTWLSIEWVAPY
jgi:hypothetical protein